MTKSKFHKKKIIPLAIVLTLVILGIYNLNSAYALHMQGNGAVFDLDEDDPLGYGVIIPSPNMYTTYYVDGSNQGEFRIMDFRGATQTNGEIISDYPGDDISLFYPQYFENYITETDTMNDYINPWSIKWFNVSAYNAESEALSPFTVNSVFNYYIMKEGGTLTAPLNYSIPMQIDIMIDNIGPKLLRYQFLADALSTITTSGGPEIDDMALISPSGKRIFALPAQAGIVKIEGEDPPGGTLPIEGYAMLTHYYFEFVAHETGTYRLLLNLVYDKPAYLHLSFLNYELSTITPGDLKFDGTGDENPTWNDVGTNTFSSKWYRFRVNKGELYTLYLGKVYNTIELVGEAEINNLYPYIFIPCENMYIPQTGNWGTNIIYAPSDGYVYLSMDQGNIYSLMRYSLYLNKIPSISWGINQNKTTIKISRDQYKALEFSVEQDSFVRINYTKYMDGDIRIGDRFDANNLFFKDAKKLSCFDVISPLEVKVIENARSCYYYLPAGDYVTLIYNDDQTKDGVIEINSNLITLSSSAIPINSLSYPDTYPSNFLTMNFAPDDYYATLKQAQVFNFTLNSIGQYRLNITVNATDNLGALPTSVNPAVIIFYNETTQEYNDFTTIATTEGPSFPVFTDVSDELYIAYSSKWHDMHFNFSQVGDNDAGTDLYPMVWYNDDWNDIGTEFDATDEFENNGTWNIDISGAEFLNWKRGCDFDIPSIDEDAYYWLRFDCVDDYDGTGEIVPYIDLISLSNITIHGNLNLAIIRDSDYQYCDFWEPIEYLDQADILINQEAGYSTYTFEGWLFHDYYYSDGGTPIPDPYILGFEGGEYKLVVIPDGWSHSGALNVKMAIEDFWGYHIDRSYTIDKEPLAKPWQIGNHVLVKDNILYNYTTYPYDLTITYNDTEVSWVDHPGYPNSWEAYIAIHCSGYNYSWTQLVIETANVTDYELYLLQDLPWDDNYGPNFEVNRIGSSISGNSTIEFGVMESDFILLFEILGDGTPDEMVTLKIGLSQYNTTILTTSEAIASYKAPSQGLSGPLVLGLAIGIPVAAGVIVLIYVLRKKGRIGSKTP